MPDLFATLSLTLSIGLAGFYLKDRKRSAFDLATRHTDALRAWHGEVVVVLVRMRSLDRPIASLEHQSDSAMLSALIEQGRFFFPNIDRRDEFGSEKPPAYRGYRNLALDFLVASYNLMQREFNSDRQKDAEQLQRYFTSIVFEVVRPAERLREIRRETDHYFAQQKSFEDFFRHPDGHLIEHIWRR
jgi:hypothetical protein